MEIHFISHLSTGGLEAFANWFLVLQQCFDNALRRMTVAKWIRGMCHFIIGDRIIQQPCRLSHDAPRIGTDQAENPGSHAFRTLRLLPQHQGGFAKCRSFLLDAT